MPSLPSSPFTHLLILPSSHPTLFSPHPRLTHIPFSPHPLLTPPSSHHTLFSPHPLLTPFLSHHTLFSPHSFLTLPSSHPTPFSPILLSPHHFLASIGPHCLPTLDRSGPPHHLNALPRRSRATFLGTFRGGGDRAAFATSSQIPGPVHVAASCWGHHHPPGTPINYDPTDYNISYKLLSHKLLLSAPCSGAVIFFPISLSDIHPNLILSSPSDRHS